MTDAPWRDEATLRELYEEQDMTVKEVADELGCSAGTVSNWLDKFDIQTEIYDPNKSGPWRDKDTLEQMFYDEGMTRDEIANKFGITRHCVNDWLRKHDLQPDNPTLKWGYLCTAGSGYEQFVDYTNSNFEKRVQIHRLLAVAEYGVDSVKDNHVHHKNRVPWDNRPSNIDVMTPSDHMSHHHSTGND